MYNSYNRPSGGYNRNGGSNSRGGYGRNQNQRPSAPAEPYKPLEEGSYIDEAEKVIKNMKGEDGRLRLTTSKIRNLLAMSAEILNKVNSSLGLNEPTSPIGAEIRKEIGYLRVRTVYECGREPNVRDFVEKTHLIDCIKDVKTLEEAERFCHYMEALVAFHRYYGGKD
jgi:CRISPR-associated protein Csm2